MGRTNWIRRMARKLIRFVGSLPAKPGRPKLPSQPKLSRVAPSHSGTEHDPGEFAPLGTSDWRSYACLRAGVRSLENGDLALSRSLFRRALDCDGHNYGAMHNLAALASKPELPQALSLLEQAKREIEKRKDHRELDDWYSTKYQIAATVDYLGTNHELAVELARQLLTEIDAKLEETRTSGSQEGSHAKARTASEQTLLDFLEELEPMVAVSYAIALVNTKSGDSAAEAEAVIGSLNYEQLSQLRVQYNLSCYLTTRADHEVDPAKRKELFDEALKRLEAAVQGGKDVAASAERDPDLHPLEDARKADFVRILKSVGVTPGETNEPESLADLVGTVG